MDSDIDIKESKILEAFSTAFPELTEFDKDRLLAFGEGMAFKANQQRETIPTNGCNGKRA